MTDTYNPTSVDPLEREEDARLLPSVLLQYWNAVVRRRWLILAILAASLVISAVTTQFMTPRYTATTQIDISRQQKEVTSVEAVEGGSSNRSNDAEFYATQYEVLKARALAEEVVEARKLDQRAEFFRAHDSEMPDPNERNRIATSLLVSNIAIQPVAGSRLVNIQYTSQNPALSAEIADAWVDGFIALNMSREFNASSDARKFLEERLEIAKARLEESERTASNFATQNNIVTLQSFQSSDEQNAGPRTLALADLDAMNSALQAARAARIAAESKLGAGASERSAEMLASPNIVALRGQQQELGVAYAKMMLQFEPSHPPALAIVEQQKTIERAIAQSAARIQDSWRRNLAEAEKAERALQDQVDQLKTELSGQQTNAVQYTILLRDADTNRQIYDTLLQRYKEIGVAGAIGASNIAVIDQAQIPRAPSSPNLQRNLVLAFALGLGLAAAVIFALEQIDERVRGPSDVTDLLKLPVLGSVPLIDDEPQDALADPKSALSEAYFSVRSALSFSTAAGFPQAITVVSTRPGEGKSTSSLAIASAVGRTGKSVLIVDGDLRAPSLHRLVGIDNKAGFSNALTGADDLEQLVRPTSFRGVSAMTSGPLPPSPSELLSTERLTTVLERLKGMYDHVIIDAPPTLGLSDAVLLASACKGCVFVIEPTKAPLRAIREALETVGRSQTRIYGAIMTKIDFSKMGYGYGYGYGYGRNEKTDGRVKEQPEAA